MEGGTQVCKVKMTIPTHVDGYITGKVSFITWMYPAVIQDDIILSNDFFSKHQLAIVPSRGCLLFEEGNAIIEGVEERSEHSPSAAECNTR